jgi:hippurate hydrolase
MVAPMHALLAAARARSAEIVDLRRALHRIPEVGLELPTTQAAVLGALEGLPLAIRKGRALSSVVAKLEGARPGPTVLLRADMDALAMPEENDVPYRSERAGAAHMCGHDAHMAMLVGAARLLAERRDALSGSVLFMFQPGEEGAGGAGAMLEEGLLDRSFAGEVTRAFAIHQFPTIPAGHVALRPGAMMAAADGFRIVVRGRGGHGSAPHEALDPVPIAAEIVLALQTLITRRVGVFDPAVITVGKLLSGTAPNVIPEIATLEGLARSVSEATRAKIAEGMRRVAEGIAAAHGATVTVEIGVGELAAFPVTFNDPEATRAIAEAAAGVLGAERVLPMENPVMASEDFSMVLQKVPGAMVFLGTRPPGDGAPQPLHSTRMMLDEAELATGAALHAAVAMDHLR